MLTHFRAKKKEKEKEMSFTVFVQKIGFINTSTRTKKTQLSETSQDP